MQYEDDAPPGYRYVTSATPDGFSVRYLEEIPVDVEQPAPRQQDRSIPMATPEGKLIPTPPSLDQMKYELSQRKTPADLGKFLLNLPTETRNQAMAVGEMIAGLGGGITSQLAGAATGVGRNIYDLITQGRVDPKATRAAASKAAELLSYQPTLPSAQSATETLGNTLGQLPPLVSGVNPAAMTLPRGALGSVKAGVARDIDQFSNDIYNAQRGITPGYETLGTRFSDAFVTPAPTVYEMLAGLEPSNVPSTASAAVKPVGKGNTLDSFYGPFPSTDNPAGMTSSLASTYKKTFENAMTDKYKAGAALDKYADEVRRVNPEFDQRVYQRLEEYVIERIGVVPDHVKPYQLQLVEHVNDFAKDWNTANPTSKIPTFDQFLNANKAYNEWLLGPNKNYIERQMGTGAATDPVLAEIEKTGLNPFPDETNFAESALNRRTRAKEVHQRNPNLPLGNIGQQTAKTEAGIRYEDISDSFFKVMSKNQVSDDFVIPPETRAKFDAIRSDEPIYDVREYQISPIRPFQDKLYRSLLTGDIKPENVSNVSMQRLVMMLYKDEQDKLKALSKDKDAYAKYKKAFFDQAPAPMVDKTTESGAKFIRFNKDSPLSPSDLVRTMCIDTKDLNHCLASGGHSVGDYKGYAPVVEPHTGKPPRGVRADATTGYIDGVKKGSKEIVSYRGSDGSTIATIEEDPYPDGRVQIVQIMSNNDEAIKNPAHAKEVRQWMNDNADRIETYSSGAVLGHVGNPIDLYKSDALKKITNRDSSINPDALQDVFYSAQMDAAIALDGEFSEWYQTVTGRNFADDFFDEPVSNILESSGFGSEDLGRLEEILGEKVSRPEYQQFIARASNLDNNTKGAAQSIGRFVTLDELKQYAKDTGISLKYPDIDIATAPREDLMAYSKRLDKEIEIMEREDADREELSHVRRRQYEVDTRVEELNNELRKANHDAVNDIFKDLPNIDQIRTTLKPIPSAYADLLRSTLEITEMRPFNETGPLLTQLELLRGPTQGNLLNIDQRESIRRGLLRRTDALAALFESIEQATGDFNITTGRSTLEQNAQAAQMVADWLKYRLENTDMRQFGVPVRDDIAAELGLPEGRINPNMTWTEANYLRDLWREFDQNGYVAEVANDMQPAATAILGSADVHSRLPRTQHWAIARVLANPDTTNEQLTTLRNSIREAEGQFSPLMPQQRDNALRMIDDWRTINRLEPAPAAPPPGASAINAQRAIPNMNRETQNRLIAINTMMNEFLDTGVIEDVPVFIEEAVNTLAGNQAPAAILPQALHRNIIFALTSPTTTIGDISDLYRQTMQQGGGPYEFLNEYQRVNARAMIEDWCLLNNIDIIAMDPGMAQGGQVRRMADGGPVTDTLDKMVKNTQASTLLNLDLPNLIAAKQQTKTLKHGGRVKFANNIDAMRLALSKG